MLKFFENPVFKNRSGFVESYDSTLDVSEYTSILEFQNETEKLREID